MRAPRTVYDMHTNGVDVGSGVDAATAAIRVFVVGGQQMVSDGLGRALDGFGDLDVVGRSIRPLLDPAEVTGLHADVAVIDVDAGPADAQDLPLAAVRRLREEAPTVRLLALGNPAAARDALFAGCLGLVSKQDSIDSLASGVRRVYRGEVIIDHHAFETLLASESRNRTGPRLTRREMEILQLIADGLRSPAIAARLTISVDTVRTHTSNVLTKLGAHSQLEAVAIARRLQLLSGT